MTKQETISSSVAVANAASHTILRRSAADAPTYRIGDSRIAVLAGAAETGGIFSLVEISCMPKGGPPPHVHSRDEIFYIVEGTITFRLASGFVEATPGMFLYVPKGSLQLWCNESNAPARLLTGYFPGGFEAYFADTHEPDGIAQTTREDYVARMMAPSAKHGIDFRVPGITTEADIWADAATGDGGNRILGPDEGDPLQVVNNLFHFKVEGKDTDGAFVVWTTTFAPGAAVPPHLHRNEDEVLYVLDGEMTWYMPDGTPERVGPGGFVYSPRNTKHAWRNETDKPATALAIATPAGIESYFRAFGSKPGGAPAPNDLSRRMEIAAQYGIESIEFDRS